MIWRRHADQLKSRFNEIIDSDSDNNSMSYKNLDTSKIPEIIPSSEPNSEDCPELLGSRPPEALASHPVVTPQGPQPDMVSDQPLPERLIPSPRRDVPPVRNKSLTPVKVPTVPVTTRSGRAIKAPKRYAE